MMIRAFPDDFFRIARMAGDRHFGTCVALSVMLHLTVLAVVAGWATRPFVIEQPEQRGIPVEFVINAPQPPPAEPASCQNPLASDLDPKRQITEATSEKLPAEKSVSPTKHPEIPRTPANARGTGCDGATPAPQGNPRPEYPEFARRKGWQGACLLRVVVSPEGKATGISLQQSSGYAILDQSAVAAVKRWKFLPRIIGGEPVTSTIGVPVHFSLLDRQDESATACIAAQAEGGGPCRRRGR